MLKRGHQNPREPMKDKKKERGLFKRKDSPHWWIRYADQNGRIIRISTNTDNRTLAKDILAKKRTLVAEGKHLDVKRLPNVTFHDLCKQYWELHGKNLRMKGLDSLIEIWKTGLGNTPLREITQQKIERFLSERMESEELSPSTRNRHLAMLKSVFNKALEWGMLLENPASAIKNLREQGARTRFLSTTEIDALLAHASERFRPILIMALHTGMRRGEIFKLKWVDVDFINRMITIQESKSGKKRMIPMDDTLTETLRMLPSRFQKGLVFPTTWRKNGKDGEADPERGLTDINHTFTRLCGKAGIEGVRFHDLRHTFASHLVMNGVDLRPVQELLGHATMNMTLRYAHLAPAHQTKAVKVLDAAYRTPSPATAAATGTITGTVANSVREAATSPSE